MIRLFLSDIDGVLTDGGYYVIGPSSGWDIAPNEMLCKRYFSRDFQGIQMLHEEGIAVGFISRADSSVDRTRISKALPYATLLQGVLDKKQSVLDTFVAPGLYEWSEIAYVGDDVIDIELLKSVGWAACPADAEHDVFYMVDERKDGFVSAFPGGYGCVRECCNIILSQVRYNKAGQRSGDFNASG